MLFDLGLLIEDMGEKSSLVDKGTLDILVTDVWFKIHENRTLSVVDHRIGIELKTLLLLRILKLKCDNVDTFTFNLEPFFSEDTKP